MGKLNFKDIQDWTPSSISVVDQPDHPLAVFEVYEDDEEFVKKSISLEDIMTNQENIEVVDNQMVSGPVSFFEKLLSRNVVTKATEPPAEPPEKPPEKEVSNEEIMKKLEALEERVNKLENPKDDDNQDDKKDDDNPVDDNQVVTKSEEPPKNEDDLVDDSKVVTKSREVDPDELVVTKSEKTRMERMGRKNNGMTW